MTLVISPQTLPPSVTLERVQKLSAALTAREQLLRQIIARFEGHYACSLSELNQRLAARQLPEHPAWEDAIEWGNAVDQLGQAQLTQSILALLINLLKRSTSS
jgi:hypothetical protein